MKRHRDITVRTKRTRFEPYQVANYRILAHWLEIELTDGATLTLPASQVLDVTMVERIEWEVGDRVNATLRDGRALTHAYITHVAADWAYLRMTPPGTDDEGPSWQVKLDAIGSEYEPF